MSRKWIVAPEVSIANSALSISVPALKTSFVAPYLKLTTDMVYIDASVYWVDESDNKFITDDGSYLIFSYASNPSHPMLIIAP